VTRNRNQNRGSRDSQGDSRSHGDRSDSEPGSDTPDSDDEENDLGSGTREIREPEGPHVCALIGLKRAKLRRRLRAGDLREASRKFRMLQFELHMHRFPEKTRFSTLQQVPDNFALVCVYVAHKCGLRDLKTGSPSQGS
jgi:hypothetical protein